MAPEILWHRPYDSAVDIFALGIVAIEMAEGNAPHKGKQKLELREYYKANFTKLEEEEKWSDEFNDFVIQSTAVDPKKRATADILLQHPFILKYSNIQSFRPPKRISDFDSN